MIPNETIMQMFVVFLIIIIRQNPYEQYIYDRYSYSTRQNSRGSEPVAWPQLTSIK